MLEEHLVLVGSVAALRLHDLARDVIEPLVTVYRDEFLRLASRAS